MKKVVWVFVLILALLFTCSCGASEPVDLGVYGDVNWEDYLSLPDYMSYEVTEPEVNITDEDVEKEISDRLAEADEENTLKEGVVEEGDTIVISFKGELEDGTTMEGLSGDDFRITLGSAPFIDGFQEGLYGKKVGDTVELDLRFPDPYEPNADLSGKGVHFSVTIDSKVVGAELDEEFIKADSEGECTTEEEYREFIREYLKKMEYDTQVFDKKTELYYKIVDETEIKEIPEEIYAAEKKAIEDKYTNYALSTGKDWETFVKENFGSAEKYAEELDTFVKDQATQKMVVYALCDKEGIVITEDDRKEAIDKLLEGYGVDEEGFKKEYGISVEDYAEAYNTVLNLHLESFLDKIYDGLQDGQ